MVNLDFIENINYVEFRKMTPARGGGGVWTLGHQKH